MRAISAVAESLPFADGSFGAEMAASRCDERFGVLRTQPSFEGALRLVVSLPG